MKRLLLIELNKLIPYKTFWIFFGGYAFLYFLIASAFTSLINHFQTNSIQVTSTHILAFPNAWQTFSWMGSFFFLLLGLLIILLLTNEFETRTLRQQIIDGLSREQYLIGRYLLIVLFSAYACLIVFSAAIIFGSATQGEPVFSKYSVIFTGTLFLQGIGLLSFALLVSFIVKKAMLATFIYIAFPIIIEPSFGWFIDTRLNQGFSNKLPLHVLFSYIPTPQFIMSKTMVLPSPGILVEGSLYVAFMILLTWFIFKFSDI